MVAERGVELDAHVEQRFVRLRELLDEVLRSLPAVDVVAEHDDPVERELRVEPRHLIRDVILRRIARPGIADGGELHRIRCGGKRELLGRDAPPCRDERGERRQEPSGALAIHMGTREAEGQHRVPTSGSRDRQDWFLKLLRILRPQAAWENPENATKFTPASFSVRRVSGGHAAPMTLCEIVGAAMFTF